MKLKAILFLLVVGIFGSCTKEYKEMKFKNLYGFIPCADCAGISVQLEFLNDHKYKAKVLYGKKGAIVEEYAGQYEYVNDSIISLNNTDLGLNNFVIREDGVMLLDKEDKLIQSDFQNRYMLYPEPPDMFSLEPETWAQARVFKAFGVEPSWSLSINPEEMVAFDFNSIDVHELSVKAPYVEPERKDGKLMYRNEIESATLIVSIDNKECSDGMSDNTYSHTVSVWVRPSNQEDGIQYSGCGYYEE